jgi:hypothetical protein|tara:strand:- start:2875 stop:3495 length:621 start_codon:yes stop_codon:yes gene_type:complete
MSLDKKFLKFKLEKIKNKRIFKDQDTETKRRIRKENSEYASEEADAIHSYLTGEDELDALDNKSFLENRAPGNLFLEPKRVTIGNKEEWRGNLNIRQVQSNPKIKKSILARLLKRFKTISNANLDSSKQMIIFKKIFDKLNITFGSNEVQIHGKLVVDEISLTDGSQGINTEFVVAGAIVLGVATYKRIKVKNGLIVSVENTILPV